MSETDELEQRRQEIIERIKQVFPKNPPENLTLRNRYDLAAGERLREMLDGKLWEEVIYHKSVIYNFTEVDHLWELTDEAYCYYLPAFLVAALNAPEKWVFYSFEIMLQNLSYFSQEQIATLIAHLEYFVQFAKQDSLPDYSFIEAIEDTLPHLTLRRDELAAGEK
jgi:hypothetical protein